MDDRSLLRDLKAALEQSEGQSATNRVEAIQAVLDAYGATVNDVARLLHRARRRRKTELGGLAQRLGGLIARREEMEETAEAVERFLRSR